MLHDVEPNVFAQILRWLYTNQAELTQETAVKMLRAADLFLLGELKRRATEAVMCGISAENVMQVLELAEHTSSPRLALRCMHFVRAHEADLDVARIPERLAHLLHADEAMLRAFFN